MAPVRRLKLSKDGMDTFEILVTNNGYRDELWVTVDHYIRPDASDDHKVICLGLGGLDAKEFDRQVDSLIEELKQLKPMAARHFSAR